MSKPIIAFAAIAFAVVAAGGGPASAHHSYAMFDDGVTLTIPGTVKSWDWTNPHSFLQVIADADGQQWSLESASPSLLSRNGLNRNSLKPGDKVTVKAHPRRDKSDGGSLLSVTLLDGRILMFEAARPAGAGSGGGRPAQAPAQ